MRNGGRRRRIESRITFFRMREWRAVRSSRRVVNLDWTVRRRGGGGGWQWVEESGGGLTTNL